MHMITIKLDTGSDRRHCVLRSMATLLEAVGGGYLWRAVRLPPARCGQPRRAYRQICPHSAGCKTSQGTRLVCLPSNRQRTARIAGRTSSSPTRGVTTYEDREYGGKLPGDLAFLSAFAPNAYHPTRDGYFVTSSGHDVFHYSRLVGLHRLNHMLSQLTEKNAAGRYQNVLILGPPDRTADGENAEGVRGTGCSGRVEHGAPRFRNFGLTALCSATTSRT